MVVKVVLCQIGEHSNTHFRAIHAVLLDPYRGGLHGYIGHFLICKSTQLTLQQHSIWGGHARICQCRHNTCTQSTYHATVINAF